MALGVCTELKGTCAVAPFAWCSRVRWTAQTLEAFYLSLRKASVFRIGNTGSFASGKKETAQDPWTSEQESPDVVYRTAMFRGTALEHMRISRKAKHMDSQTFRASILCPYLKQSCEAFPDLLCVRTDPNTNRATHYKSKQDQDPGGRGRLCGRRGQQYAG